MQFFGLCPALFRRALISATTPTKKNKDDDYEQHPPKSIDLKPLKPRQFTLDLHLHIAVEVAINDRITSQNRLLELHTPSARNSLQRVEKHTIRYGGRRKGKGIFEEAHSISRFPLIVVVRHSNLDSIDHILDALDDLHPHAITFEGFGSYARGATAHHQASHHAQS